MSFGDEPLGTTPLGTTAAIVAAFKAFWARCATIVQNMQGMS